MDFNKQKTDEEQRFYGAIGQRISVLLTTKALREEEVYVCFWMYDRTIHLRRGGRGRRGGGAEKHTQDRE